MVLRDPDGRFVMIDDPRFDPILDFIKSSNKTLVAHLGETRNCWLPVEEMTVDGDRDNFKWIHETYYNDYRYFATDEEMDSPSTNGKIRGLKLPPEVLKKYFIQIFTRGILLSDCRASISH